jgi:hypothetical protein
MKTEHKKRAINIIEAIDQAANRYEFKNDKDFDFKLIGSGIISAILYLAEVIREKK